MLKRRAELLVPCGHKIVRGDHMPWGCDVPILPDADAARIAPSAEVGASSMSSSQAPPSPRPSGLRAITARQWLAILLVILSLIFIIQNRKEVKVHLFGFTVEAPLWAILLVTAAVGVLIGALLGRRPKRSR